MNYRFIRLFALAFVLVLLFMSGCNPFKRSAPDLFGAMLNKTLHEELAIQPSRLQNASIGLSLIPHNYDDSVDGWFEALTVAQHLGVQVLQLPSGYWKEDEPVQGAYQWDAMERFFEAIDMMGIDFDVSQDFGGPFFHDQNMAPEYLQPIELIDPMFGEAYLSYLEAYLERFGDRITHILIHAEGAYSYFDAHPDHLDAYLNLLDRIRDVVNQRWPKVRVGVNIDPQNRPELLSAISSHLDFVGFDVVQTEGFLEQPVDLESVINFILTNTANQPISLACVWSSAPNLGGGEEPQSKLYQEVFRILQKHQSRIEYVVVGPPFDENKEIVRPAYEAQFSHLPKPFVAEIVDWIVQLGLIRTDGSGKPALQTVRTEIQKYYDWRGHRN